MLNLRLFVLASCTLALTAAACAQRIIFNPPPPASSAHTWVASTGTDTGLCPRTAPCKTFQFAVNATSANGEVSTVDPDDYGPVTITKSITIDGGGAARIVTTPTTASPAGSSITVSALQSDVVRLRNLNLDGDGASLGILVTLVGHLDLDNLKIDNYSDCIDMNGIPSTGTGTDVSIKNSSIDNCTNTAISSVGSGQTLTVQISNTQVHFAVNGLSGVGFIRIAGSSFSGAPSSPGIGIGNLAGGDFMLSNCQISGFQVGVAADGSVQLSGNTFSHNAIALDAAIANKIFTNGNNSFFNNGKINNFPNTLTPAPLQ